MTHRTLLTVTSLLSVTLMSLHITDDIVRRISPPGADNIGAVVIFVVWLLGTLVLGDRQLGRVIMLLGGLFAAAMPVLHMRGASYPRVAVSEGGFFFVWSLIAVGTSGMLALVLATAELWRNRRPSSADDDPRRTPGATLTP
jgi:hypothetical protein